MRTSEGIRAAVARFNTVFVDDVQELTTEDIVVAIRRKLTEDGYADVINIAFKHYMAKDTGNLVSVVFSVTKGLDKKNIECAIEVLKTDKRYVINLLLDTIDRFIELYLAEANVLEFNLKLDVIALKQGYKQRIHFTVSSEVVSEITEDGVQFGLSKERACMLSELRLFNLTPLTENGFEKIVGDLFKSTVVPYMFITEKNILTLELGIYTRKNIINILKSRFSYKAYNVGEGNKGYVEQGGYFSVLQRINKLEAELYPDVIYDSKCDKYYVCVIKPINIQSGNRVDMGVRLCGKKVEFIGQI